MGGGLCQLYSLCCFINTTTVYYITPHVYINHCMYICTTACAVLDIKRVENAIFHTMYIFSVILHANDKQDIST